MKQAQQTLTSEKHGKTALAVIFAIICFIWVLPVVAVVINSFKLNTYVKTETFALPAAESFASWQNFITGVTFSDV